MNKIFAITVAYCPAILLARTLIEYKKNRSIEPFRHIVVLGHYPINKEKNNRDIKMICESLNTELWDPGEDLGSAQSQNWVLSRLLIEKDDYMLNIDPDSNCTKYEWDLALKLVLDNDQNCTLVSCYSDMVDHWIKAKDAPIETKIIEFSERYHVKYIHTSTPIPFNLSLWRCDFIKELGGIPQMGLWWGETEAPWHHESQIRGKYHAYLTDYIEDESGKFMQDKQHNEYKDLHMRTIGPAQFCGSFGEFLQYKYPELYNLNTLKLTKDN